jgi:hypothetical protein
MIVLFLPQWRKKTSPGVGKHFANFGKYIECSSEAAVMRLGRLPLGGFSYNWGYPNLVCEGESK